MKLRTLLPYLVLLAALTAPSPSLAQVKPPENWRVSNLPAILYVVTWCSVVFHIESMNLDDNGETEKATTAWQAFNDLFTEFGRLAEQHGIDRAVIEMLEEDYAGMGIEIEEQDPQLLIRHVEECTTFHDSYFAPANRPRGYLPADDEPRSSMTARLNTSALAS